MTKTPLLLLVVVAACSDDPVNYSAPVGIELKVKSSDVTTTGNALTPEKGITTESGNPYGAFITEAENTLGKAPARIELESVTLTLGAQSTNVSALEQVMTGDVYVSFLTSDTNNTFVAGHWASPTGIGPVDGHPGFDWDAVGGPDAEKLLGANFKVVLNAPVAADFTTKGAEASLQVTFTFSAFE